MKLTNEERAIWAERAFKEYPGLGDDWDNVRELISGLGHMLVERGYDKDFVVQVIEAGRDWFLSDLRED